LGQGLRADRLGGGYILVDYRCKNVGLALPEPAAVYHALYCSTPAAGVLAGA
jgi:hypothetical protein